MGAAWIGPAIVAAIISALVTAAGWYVADRQAERREVLRRKERIVDLQTAVLAEIRASRFRLEGGSLREHAAAMDIALEHGETPFVPTPVPNVVFEAVPPDLHLLPNRVIDPVVVYYRQMLAVAALVDAIRSDRYEKLAVGRKRAVYRDYVDLLIYADQLAVAASDALGRSLNIQVADPSDPLSGEGQASALGDSASSPLSSASADQNPS